MWSHFLSSSAACTTLSCIFLLDAGNELRGGMKGETTEKNEEESGKERKTERMKKQDILFFYKMFCNYKILP